MVVCAEPVLPADGRRVWEPVDLDAGAEGAEGDGVTLVAHDHVIPHRAGTTGKILKVSGDLHLIAHNCPQLPAISASKKFTWESPHVMQLERPQRRENISSMLGLTRRKLLMVSSLLLPPSTLSIVLSL